MSDTPLEKEARHSLAMLVFATREPTDQQKHVCSKQYAARLTLDLYTHTVSQQKRDANNKVVELLMPEQALNAQHLSAPSPQ